MRWHWRRERVLGKWLVAPECISEGSNRRESALAAIVGIGGKLAKADSLSFTISVKYGTLCTVFADAVHGMDTFIISDHGILHGIGSRPAVGIL